MAMPGQQYQLPFSGYTPHPQIQDAYMMHPTAGGAPLLFDGPSSANMRALIDQTPQADNRLADNSLNSAMQAFGGNASPTTVTALEGPPPGPQAPQASATDVGSANMATLFGGGDYKAPPTPAATPTPQASFSPPPGPAGQVAGAAPQVPQGPRTINTGEQAPTADSGAQQPKLDARQFIRTTTSKAGFTPTSQSMSVKGGIQDPRELAAMARMYGNAQTAEEQAAADQKLVLQTTADANKTALVQETNKQLGLEAKEADRVAKMQQAADTYENVMGKAQKDYEKMASREVKPNRVFEGKPGAQIMAALAAGMGAFGASISHTPNFALDFINKQIDRDIDAQRDEINRGTSAKQNDIMRIRDQYNVSTNVAEKIAAMQATQYAGVMARKQAAMLGGQQAQLALAKIDQQLAESTLARGKDLHNTISGEVETKSDQKYHAGGTSTSVDPALKAWAQANQLLGQGAVGLSTAEHEGMAPGKQAVAPPGGEKQLIPRMAPMAVAAETALAGLYKLREKAIKQGRTGNALESVSRLGGTTDYDADAEHMAAAMASLEAGGNKGDTERVHMIEHGLTQNSVDGKLAHIDSLIEQAKIRLESAKSVSANTARVGSAGGRPEDSSE